MNIILPIISNLLIVTMIIAGVFIGKKNGVKLELIKLLVLAPICAGIYFLSPVITNLIINTETIKSLNLINSFELFSSLITIALFTISYLLLNITVKLIRKHKKDSINNIKPIKVKGLNRKETRKLRKEQKQLDKLNRPKRSLGSKIFGATFGLIIALFSSFIIMLPIKFGAIELSNKLNKPEINSIYEYTPYGQLDKVIQLSDYIIKK